MPSLTPLRQTHTQRRRAENGLLDTTLRILPTRVTDGPVSFSSRAYEGTVPGPTLMLKPGDTMRLLQVSMCESVGCVVVEDVERGSLSGDRLICPPSLPPRLTNQPTQ